jgi:hypothetical protein
VSSAALSDSVSGYVIGEQAVDQSVSVSQKVDKPTCISGDSPVTIGFLCAPRTVTETIKSSDIQSRICARLHILLCTVAEAAEECNEVLPNTTECPEKATMD